MTPRDHAVALYMEGIRDGRPREAVVAHTGARYTQHSTGVADGAEGFVAFFEPFIARNPSRDIRIVHALQDGAHVFVHAHQNLNDGAASWVTMDFFDSDADGRIVEHWDVIAPAAAAPGSRGHSGVAEIVDHDRTDANKAHVHGYLQTCLIGRATDAMGRFVDTDRFVQHGADAAAGFAALQSFHAAPGCALAFQACFLMVGEGNFVATLNRARWHGDDQCRADLFRLDAGLIVEHWYTSEPVPPRAEWANSGKF